MFTLRELAKRLGAQIVGDADCKIYRVATLENAGEGDITFLHDMKLREAMKTTHASAVIINESNIKDLHTNGLVVNNPHLAYIKVADWLNPREAAKAGIHASAIIDAGSQIHPDVFIGALSVVESGAVIGAGCEIGPGCFIGKDVVIGENARFIANVTICHGVKIGKRVIMHPGAVIGADGFGLGNDKGRWVKVPQLGSVQIGDDVEIGANTTVDRGAIEDTILEEGVKLDNQIQIGHNAHIGAHTAIAACTGIAGSTRIGKHCAIGGAVSIVGHHEITDNVTITGMSYVTRAIREPGIYSSGTPLEENNKWRRNYMRFRQLDDMARRLKNLEKQIAAGKSKETTK